MFSELETCRKMINLKTFFFTKNREYDYLPQTLIWSVVNPNVVDLLYLKYYFSLLRNHLEYQRFTNSEGYMNCVI